MKAMQLKGNWNIFKGRMVQRWARFTDNDLQFTEGKERELIGRIQKRTRERRQQPAESFPHPATLDVSIAHLYQNPPNSQPTTRDQP